MDIGVTPQLASFLPPEPYRAQLLGHLEKTLLMHPCVNWAQFRAQIMSVHVWAQAESDRLASARTGVADSNSNSNSNLRVMEEHTGLKRPSLSLFSVAAMAYAIGAQAWLEANGGASSSPEHSGWYPNYSTVINLNSLFR